MLNGKNTQTDAETPKRSVEINVLFISIAFPPKFDSEALQVEKLIRELLKQENINFFIITAMSKYLRNMPIVDSMQDFSGKVSWYYEVPVYENRWINKILSVLGLSNLPDTKWSFFIRSRSSWKKIPHSIDVLYSRSFPPSSSIMACKLAEKQNIPWIMHLSDPWYLSPLAKFSFVEKVYNRYWERRCIKTATRVSFTTPETLGLYADNYPEYKNKMFVSCNSVEDNNIQVISSSLANGKTLNIAYTGVLNKDRDCKVFLTALRRLLSQQPGLKSFIKVRFCGPVDTYVRNLFEENEDIVEYLGVIEHSRMRELISDSDLLLAIDMRITDERKSVYLISKLLDYAEARKRIMCVTDQGSPAEKFTAEVGGVHFNRNSEESLMEFIHSAIQAKIAGDSRFFSSEQIPSRFLTSEVSKALVDEFTLLNKVR